jgi:hypothetical protein
MAGNTFLIGTANPGNLRLLRISAGILILEHFNIENVEMLWRRVPPPAPQA